MAIDMSRVCSSSQRPHFSYLHGGQGDRGLGWSLDIWVRDLGPPLEQVTEHLLASISSDVKWELSTQPQLPPDPLGSSWPQTLAACSVESPNRSLCPPPA